MNQFTRLTVLITYDSLVAHAAELPRDGHNFAEIAEPLSGVCRITFAELLAATGSGAPINPQAKRGLELLKGLLKELNDKTAWFGSIFGICLPKSVVLGTKGVLTTFRLMRRTI